VTIFIEGNELQKGGYNNFLSIEIQVERFTLAIERISLGGMVFKAWGGERCVRGNLRALEERLETYKFRKHRFLSH